SRPQARPDARGSNEGLPDPFEGPPTSSGLLPHRWLVTEGTIHILCSSAPRVSSRSSSLPAACQGRTGSGAVVAEARQAAPFSRIKVGYGIRVRQSGGLGRSVKRRRLLHVPGDRRLVDTTRTDILPP